MTASNTLGDFTPIPRQPSYPSDLRAASHNGNVTARWEWPSTGSSDPKVFQLAMVDHVQESLVAIAVQSRDALQMLQARSVPAGDYLVYVTVERPGYELAEGLTQVTVFSTGALPARVRVRAGATVVLHPKVPVAKLSGWGHVQLQLARDRSVFLWPKTTVRSQGGEVTVTFQTPREAGVYNVFVYADSDDFTPVAETRLVVT